MMWHCNVRQTLYTVSLFLMMGWLLWFTVAVAHESPPPVMLDETPANSEFFNIYTLPAGTPFHVLLQTPIHTGSSQLYDPIEASVAQDLYLGEALMISQNSRVRGRIVRLEQPIQGQNAILKVDFTDLILPNGETLPIKAYIKTDRPDHSWGGQLTPGTKPRRVTHRVWGIGDYNKTVMGGPRAMGVHLEALPGERYTIILEEPVKIVNPKRDL